MSYNDTWQPKTRLGGLVQDGEVEDMSEALDTGLPLKEPEIVDQLLPGLDDEVLDINMVQRMTDSGRRVKFRCVVAIGNRDGYVGYAEGRDDQVGGAIQKAIEVAKLNIIDVSRGCGSWECGCGRPHTVALKSTGKAGSVDVELMPAPRGLGLAGGETVQHVLELAGIDDVWTRSSGKTRTTVNFAKATFNALRETSEARVPQHAREEREVIE
ncbi:MULTISPECIES: 30S ribosomal protein S5 [Halobacterium]|uniref:Small ribosomal subunit protein uS5 n=5 Tax=Halobacterium salinarum TaxID=2242 RepID=RS5_HALSA|nr:MULTISPECIES: 30S ribosomal protein S5 [Halobacterium]Q9HPB4.1 RecName: Full=Small ribosomal subunit protein uS5; AltName: Full=30S ribosomal protein S5 [Halobacterium salinarum NRC-1]AAG19956.1 30S ribosomal protein S5P [Halobacterium salinarum NRC-1]MBB6088962.1 small subunit ribosomal protein S5 [Halobacterium salinarum]MCF2164821.1 30S ribosomal protein S5 [Halobacterium salinarum]MCF2168554.1 30S ribosomal protein S5 [Halobacterium salinarum]MCF2206187.1 30S ribosomal protein S5 [Halo